MFNARLYVSTHAWCSEIPINEMAVTSVLTMEPLADINRMLGAQPGSMPRSRPRPIHGTAKARNSLNQGITIRTQALCPVETTTASDILSMSFSKRILPLAAQNIPVPAPLCRPTFCACMDHTLQTIRGLRTFLQAEDGCNSGRHQAVLHRFLTV